MKENEVLIYSENAVSTEDWPDIYYNNYQQNRWEATMFISGLRFHIDKCDSPEEAVQRIENAVVEHFGVFEKRTGFGRRAYDIKGGGLDIQDHGRRTSWLELSPEMENLLGDIKI
jgi:hypothetical protein